MLHGHSGTYTASKNRTVNEYAIDHGQEAHIIGEGAPRVTVRFVAISVVWLGATLLRSEVG